MSASPLLDPLEAELTATERALDDASGFVPAGGRDLSRLRSGELSLTEYTDGLLERALAPYVGLLDAASLERMREVLASQLAEDPGLTALFARATSGLRDVER